MARKTFTYEDFEKEWYNFNPHLKISYMDKPTNVRSPIHCHCEICGGDYDSTIFNLQMAMKRNSKYKGCRICSNQLIVEGINDLLTQAPHIEKYIIDKEQAKHIGTCPNNHNNRKIKVKCDICGYETEKNIYDLVRYGMCCPKCGDGLSTPNKIIRIFMNCFRDKVDTLAFEYSSTWTKSKVYDTYFVINNQQYVVEMDGEQHTRDAFYKPKEYYEENDKLKDDLAKENDVIMIRIDCTDGKFTTIQHNIQNSLLAELFDITDNVWDECKKAYNSNIFLRVIEDRKQGYTLKQLVDKYHIGRSTVLRYLHRGEDLGMLKAFEDAPITYFDDIITDSKLGLSSRQLAKKYNIGRDTILRYIHQGKELGLLSS